MWPFKKKEYSRKNIIAAASHARGKGNKKKAIAELRKILSRDPKDYEVQSKIAPLLAETKQTEEAFRSFRVAAEGFYRKGLVPKSLSTYVQASRYMPYEKELWDVIARLQVEQGKDADAVKTLHKAHRHFDDRVQRRKAIDLLKQAWALVPWQFDITYDLAHQHAKFDDKNESIKLLCGLIERARSKKRLCRLRGKILRVSPDGPHLWHWVRAVATGK